MARLAALDAAISVSGVNWGPGYRIYLMKDGDKVIVLLTGGTKSRQQKDIEQALIYAKLYKARKKS